MNPWIALYVKELRENRGTFLFLIGGTVALGVYALARGAASGAPGSIIGLMMLPFVSAFIFPFLLLHSFSQEFKGQTHYQLLSLPVSRAAVVLSKVLSVLTAGVVLFGVAMANVHLNALQYAGSNYWTPFSREPADLWSLGATFYFTSLLPFLGIATAMAGLKLIVRRFQGLAMVAFLLFSLYLYGRMMSSMAELVGAAAAQHRFGFGFEHSVAWPGMLPVMLATVGFSAAFVGLGILLFERFAEA